MVRAIGRKLLWVYALLMLLVAVGYARYDVYVMDGDGTSFLDIAQYLNTHHAALAVNGYWNPGYPAVLAIAERLAHPGLWRELVVARWTNVFLFALAMSACIFFTTALVQARAHFWVGSAVALPPAAVHLAGLGLLTLSLGRELPVAAPRADTLLFALLMLAGGLLLRLLHEPRPWLYIPLGFTLGCAYLTKSFALLPSLAVLAALGAYGVLRRRSVGYALAGPALAAIVFVLVAGPYVTAVSRQLGHLSTGESARLNYAFFVDLTPRWHEWYHRDLGHAGGVFLHPETPLASQPPVFSYAAHPVGTYPLWFDPAWWTLGLKPHLWLKGHLYRLARNIALFFRFLLGRPEIFVLLAVLLASGATWPKLRQRAAREEAEPAVSRGASAWFLAPLLWGLLMLAIYFPVDLQDRYLTAPFFLVMLPLLAALRLRPQTTGPDLLPSTTERLALPSAASALVILFSGIALVQALSYVAERRRHTPTSEQRHPGFDPQIFTAAAGLRALGLRPGDKVACMGDLACYTDFYWARLADTQILAEVETPGEANPITVWDNLRDKQTVTAPLTHMGLRYIVSLFPNSGSKPSGWIQLGSSNFFAYPLAQTVTPQQAANVAALKVIP